MLPTSNKQTRQQSREPRAGLTTLLVVASALAGFVWWRKRKAGSSSSAASGSAFNFPKAKPTQHTPVEKKANNKKYKKRRAEERERRAEKRERKEDAAPQKEAKDPKDPNNTLILNHSYFDTARRDTKF